MRRRAFRLSMCWLSLVCVPAWAGTTLREAVDQAWERAVAARVAESRRAEADASRAVADSWFAEPPSIGLAEKSDRFNNNRGLRERELDVALPLWLPGQRAAREGFAARDAADAQAGLAAARLALAGDVRAAVWNLAAAQAELDIATERLATAEKLEIDVARRQMAGDLARTDLLLAQEETLTAQGALTEARTRQRQAMGRLQVLTGLDSMPSSIDETVSPETNAMHPRAALAQASVELARANLEVAQADRRNPPELSIGVVQTRDDFAAPSYNTVRLGLRFPLGTDARNAPKLAVANSVVIKAVAESQQTLSEIEVEQQSAQLALENAQSLYRSAQTRATLAAERLALQEKAFSLGELSLAEFMRMRATANEARLEQLRARSTLGAARAQFNQAKGLLP